MRKAVKCSKCVEGFLRPAYYQEWNKEKKKPLFIKLDKKYCTVCKKLIGDQE